MFSSFLSENEIIHQSICPHTPQQNGIVERNNKDVVDTPHTLLLLSIVLVRQSGDATLIDCHLTIIMISSSHNNQVPHSIVFSKEFLFHRTRLVSGLTYFIHNLTPGLDNLSEHAIKCILLGYSRFHKKRLCYSPIMNRYYISTDVTLY